MQLKMKDVLELCIWSVIFRLGWQKIVYHRYKKGLWVDSPCSKENMLMKMYILLYCYVYHHPRAEITKLDRHTC